MRANDEARMSNDEGMTKPERASTAVDRPVFGFGDSGLVRHLRDSCLFVFIRGCKTLAL
jgi:hypothetical protein